MLNDLNDFIFSPNIPFTGKALKVFQFQYHHNELYKRFADALNCNPGTINNIHQIPFLPISFFKTHSVTTTTFEPQLMFESRLMDDCLSASACPPYTQVRSFFVPGKKAINQECNNPEFAHRTV